MTTSKRFNDENYKNWLKTAESLAILRSRIQDFVEKETETYHRSLRNKPALSLRCTNNCEYKNNKSRLCDVCNNWKDEIEANHKAKKTIHLENCRPHLWSIEKWEVAKAYMSRGQKQHCKFAQFDVSAILNFMNFCKHFNDIPRRFLSSVINVRNSVMHSPDMKISNEEMARYLHNVLEFAKDLEPYASDLKGIREEITQFNNILDKNFCQTSQNEVDGKQEDIQSMKDIQKVLDREQQAMKEKIEDILFRFEGNPDKTAKEEPQGMNNLLDFLDQNKDLLENLGPQVTKLKEMQDKVDQHDQQITNLTDRVDQLEQVTHDPVCPDKPPRYKNHLLEYSRAKKWLDPKFTEDQEAQGYRGRVEVNGQIFTGKKVWNSRKAAHQEVACIALEQLKSQDETTNEPSSSSASSVIQTDTSSSPSLGITFFSKVTVVLNQEVESDGCYSNKEEAIESSYQVLWKHLQGVMDPVQGRTYRSAIMEYFMKCGFQKPAEVFDPTDDNTTICKLKLNGPFTFYDRVGSTKKKQAEQQAAKVALQHLSGILNSAPISDTETNFKGVLKERLEGQGLKSPIYETEQKEGPSIESVNSGTSQELSNSSVTLTTVKQDSELESESISTPLELSSHQDSVSDTVPLTLNPQDSSSPKKAKIDCPGSTYFGKVTMVLDQEIVSDGHYSNEEEACESAYKVLWQHFCISAPKEGQTYRSTITEYISTCGFQTPEAHFVPTDDNTIICKLKLNGPFTFYDRVGSTKKKQAEQQAAKVALQHLSGILNSGPIPDTEKNFKGVLKERLEMLGLSSAIYETEKKEGPSNESVNSGTSPDRSNLSITQAPEKQDSELEPESISTPMKLSSHQEPVSYTVPLLSAPKESSSPGSHRKRARIDCPEIYELFNVFNLKPPHVKFEDIKYDQNFICTVGINFENFSFSNNQGYDTKKEAIRKTYLLFGCAVAIFDPSTDEKKSSEQVKQHFSQNSLALPQEDFETSTKPFCCLLKNITYNVVYKGQGSSESEAKLNALQKALSSLSPLFDYPSLTGADTAEEVENQLISMLKGAGQKDPIICPKDPLKKACIQLSFSDYTVKCICKGSKKEARNHLSSRILGLLGVKPEPNNSSLRNCLDEWFKKNKLQLPVFEDIEEALGAKATFSAQLTCCSPAWEDNLETAKKQLLEELRLNRFKFLTD
ncbi:uncharacterized protein si:ch211-91p5.3 [Myxocyprinus asiaticus]|uniref:uncharacterized protein si:ch211-91p5.3 n=1 Tax=Myxocyprinus asiaticus TaxID=70543 RepID=UPI0022216869|nr:uncharacterized protein si:ch211-91p5.3 [Myxocyprinus asiaticus]